ncbi:hypothetical protein CLAVI_000532 [Candidatus Clavichlamydia salmonicola]|uniref:hypothetical protein n=1 Tax=Candidatus Clavichlamydia salmonicola TaxID=469812 RepID=UPI0018913991|nr:hypothetical protein [Candidatus Clavichlamydia salmonicola]MBF5050910.1 hypothetical protein [Candidatus Clavichlamydia salmonicola]
MSFITNYFGLIPPTSVSEAARNCRRNLRHICRHPVLQAAVSSVMGVSMAVLTTEVLAGDPLISNQQSSSNNTDYTAMGMKITALAIMAVANGVILGEALTDVCGDTRISILNPTKHARNHRLYILTGLNIAGSALGLTSIISFISSSALESQQPNPLQALAISSGTVSSIAYTVEAVVALLMCSAKTLSQRRIESIIVRYQPIDSSDDDSLVNFEFGDDAADEDVWSPIRTPSPTTEPATLVEID